MDIADLERVGDGPLVVRHGGRVGELPHPASMPWQQVAVALSSTHAFMAVVAQPGARLRLSVAERLAHAWRAHHDLPAVYADVERLVYLVGRYHDDLEIDLPELGELWRGRRWRLLLNRIDHLPRWSWYARAVALDDEVAQEMAKRLAEQPEDEKAAGAVDKIDPGHWTPEVEMMSRMVNEQRMARHEFGLANSSAGSKPAAPKLISGPHNALQAQLAAAKTAYREARHRAIVAMLLPDSVPATLPEAPPDAP